MTRSRTSIFLENLAALSEPPECTCMSRGNGCSTCLDTIGWDPEEDCPSCPVHAGSNGGETEK